MFSQFNNYKDFRLTLKKESKNQKTPKAVVSSSNRAALYQETEKEQILSNT